MSRIRVVQSRVRVVQSSSITVTGRPGRAGWEARVNQLLGRFGGWRIGRSNGRRALLRVYAPDYREVVLWPWPRRKRTVRRERG